MAKYLVCILFSVMFVTACSINPVTIDERIDSFMSDINSDLDSVYNNLANTGSGLYSPAKAGSYWEVFFPVANRSYTLSGKNTSGSTVTASLDSASIYSGNAITFEMVEDSPQVWMIESITIAPATNVYF